MAGRGTVQHEDTITHPRVWMLSSNKEWVLAKDPVQFDKPEVVGVGPALSFGKAMAEQNPDVIIALVPAAVGGSSIDVWKKGVFHESTGRYPYDEAIARATYANSFGSLKGILWHQGESDCKADKVEGYEIKLVQFVNTLRVDLNAHHVPFAMGMMGDFLIRKNVYAKRINKSIRIMAHQAEGVKIVSAAGLTHGGDYLHFDAYSARELGKRYAKAFN